MGIQWKTPFIAPLSCRGFVDASRELPLLRGACAVGLLSTARELQDKSSNLRMLLRSIPLQQHINLQTQLM